MDPSFRGRTAALHAEQVSLPQDSLGFVRRECPSCHRLFKARAARAEGQRIFRRVAAHVVHANDQEVRCPRVRRSCPYCAHRADEDQWFTAEQREWLDRRGKTLSLELRYEQLACVERTLSLNPSPTFITVRPEPSSGALQAEPDDMSVVPLLCCREELKVSERWSGPLRCFYCGVEHELGAALLRDRLTRMLEPDG